MDAAHAQALDREGKLEGYRVPVYYLPPRSPWSTIDDVIAFRIQSPEQFELIIPGSAGNECRAGDPGCRVLFDADCGAR